MDKDTVTFDLHIGLLNKGIIAEIKRVAFKYDIGCEIVSNGGFLSAIYTIKLSSDRGSAYSAYKLYCSILETLEESQR